jgi:S-adenosylmethionine hydrolase
MAPRYDTISFLSDFGLVDEFVGVVKSVIRGISPEVVVIDVSHDIPRHDVRAGGLALARAAGYLAPGVVLAVVDPGVGTDRRRIAVEVGDGQSVLVGPDNGLLAPGVAMVGGATRAIDLTNAEYHLPTGGGTFDGRDVFGPVAAHLCAGVPLEDLGVEIDPVSLMPGIVPIASLEGDVISAEVLWVDHFGNAQLNVGGDEFELGPLRVRAGEASRTAQRVQSYAAITAGELGLVVDSYGLLALCLDRGSAAQELGLHAGSQISLERLGEDHEQEQQASPVTLSPRPSATDRRHP